MKNNCADCDAEPVQSDKSLFNVVYVCPDCGQQLGSDNARE
jgi:predicted RNA-binding Zn-ribbon protein involved in translation (DUF1610 family)